jgi:hypothetical protein
MFSREMLDSGPTELKRLVLYGADESQLADG